MIRSSNGKGIGRRRASRLQASCELAQARRDRAAVERRAGSLPARWGFAGSS